MPLGPLKKMITPVRGIQILSPYSFTNICLPAGIVAYLKLNQSISDSRVSHQAVDGGVRACRRGRRVPSSPGFSGNRFVLLYWIYREKEILFFMRAKKNSSPIKLRKSVKEKKNPIMFFVYFYLSKKITIKNSYLFLFFPCGGGGAWWRYM